MTYQAYTECTTAFVIGAIVIIGLYIFVTWLENRATSKWFDSDEYKRLMGR
jgi:FtsZ-interacting cell division protein ZipA